MKGTKKLIDAEALTALMSMLADDPWNADACTTWAKAYSYVIELISEQEVILELNKDITKVFVRGVEYVPVTEQKKRSKTMRPIDADSVFGYLVEEGQDHASKYGFRLGDTIKFSPSQVVEIIEKMPTIEVPRWIPVTERLPGYGIDVLTVDGYGEYEINFIRDEEAGKWYYEPVAAWIPLPEPYKGGAE